MSPSQQSPRRTIGCRPSSRNWGWRSTRRCSSDRPWTTRPFSRVQTTTSRTLESSEKREKGTYIPFFVSPSSLFLCLPSLSLLFTVSPTSLSPLLFSPFFCPYSLLPSFLFSFFSLSHTHSYIFPLLSLTHTPTFSLFSLSHTHSYLFPLLSLTHTPTFSYFSLTHTLLPFPSSLSYTHTPTFSLFSLSHTHSYLSPLLSLTHKP